MGADFDLLDPTFTQDLEDSVAYVWLAARWLSRRFGNKVVVNPTFVRPDLSQMDDYADGGDLELVQRIEVKHRPELMFTCAEDWPYDEKTVIVDVAHAWDNARPKPYAYIIINGPCSHCAIVWGRTRSAWRKVKKHDRRRNRERCFYECPLDQVDFYAIDEAALCHA